VTFIKWWDGRGRSYGSCWESWFLDDMKTQEGAQHYLDMLPCKSGYTDPAFWGNPLPLEARERYMDWVDKYELGERVSDADALASDWQAIGDDMRQAMGRII
jgi:hypothetical protein